MGIYYAAGISRSRYKVFRKHPYCRYGVRGGILQIWGSFPSTCFAHFGSASISLQKNPLPFAKTFLHFLYSKNQISISERLINPKFICKFVGRKVLFPFYELYYVVEKQDKVGAFVGAP